MDQHYLEVDESGELTKKYTQVKEEEELCNSGRPVEFTSVSLDDPAAMERGSEAEATAKPPGSGSLGDTPDAEVEKQDWAHQCNQSALAQYMISTSSLLP